MKIVFILVLSCAIAGVANDKTWPIEIKGHFFTNMETALSRASRTRGLMFRKDLPEDGGMLFVFEEPELHSFWMRNTLIPLDIVYLDQDGKVTAMHTMQVEKPQQPGEDDDDYCRRLPGYSSVKPAIAAIELNAGTAASIGLKVGDHVEIFYSLISRFLVDEQ